MTDTTQRIEPLSSETLAGMALASALEAANYGGDSGEDVDRLVAELAKRGYAVVAVPIEDSHPDVELFAGASRAPHDLYTLGYDSGYLDAEKRYMVEDPDRDAQIDNLERAMRDHLLDRATGWPHMRGGVMPGDGPNPVDGCDDNCAGDIWSRLRRPE